MTTFSFSAPRLLQAHMSATIQHWPLQAFWGIVGGQKSSVAEYAHMLVMMMNDGVYRGQHVLTKASVDQILSIQNPAIYPACLIWFDYDGWFCHYGGEEGGSTTTEFDRPHKVGFIILANRYSTSVLDVGEIYDEIKKKAKTYRN